MKRSFEVIVKNATANVIRGAATATVAGVLPHFLTRTLDKDRFSCWSLILQIAAYASFLDFGLQTALSRFLARAAATGGHRQKDELVSTSLLLLSGAGVLAALVMVPVIWQAPRLFAGLPSSDLPDFRTAASIMGLGACLALPLSTWTGVLVGLNRNEIPAIAISVTRLAGALGVVLVARHTQSLTALAICIVSANLVGSLAQVVAVKRILPELRARLRLARRAIMREITVYCAGLSAWAFSMMLISGLDLTIVGHYRFAAVGAYSIATLLTTFFAGFNQSAVSALMAPLASLQARDALDEVRAVVLRATRINCVGMFILANCMVAFGLPVMTAWVGRDYATQAYPILVILSIALALRLTLNPYSTSLVALGYHRYGIIPSLMEAFTNLAFSITGIILLGTIGVAYGTLCGAVVGLIGTFLYTVHRVGVGLPISAQELLRAAIIRPILVCLPLTGGVLAGALLHRSVIPLFMGGLCLTLGATFLAFRSQEDKDFVPVQ